jgi:type 1 glutamine amidotransferase
MIRILVILLFNLFVFSVFAEEGSTADLPGHQLIKVLILSGKNNHEWQKTTPLLTRIFNDSKLFSTRITEKPDTLSYISLKKYDLVVSNWNSWPDNNMRLSSRWESDFLRYVTEGGGALFFHAGASSFYGWESYHRVGIGRWGKDTRHGAPTKGHVFGFDQGHPVTKGMSDFYIMDEIWENTDIYPGVKIIGSLSAKDEKDGHPINVPALFVNQTGKGRSFFTTMGHDERALLNTGLQSLLLRAAQWCSGRKVTIELPPELRIAKAGLPEKFNWNQTDTSLTLRNHSEIVWQFNYNNQFGKPYFHPLKVNNTVLTCVAPPDHPWHLGLWFSWKYINGVNYWEYMSNFNSPETGYKSEGITEIVKKEVIPNPDFSSDIRMKVNYHPVNGKSVLEEERNMHISQPFKDGSYYIDEEHLFRTQNDSVILDRTPVIGESGGQSWGGYAGLSIRFNQDFTSTEIISPNDSTNYGKNNWLYMGFKSLTGEKAGISILQHPQFTTSSTSWYVINDQKVPFYYFSPAVLFDQKIVLKKGENLHLKYRIRMLPGVASKETLQEKFKQYLNK